MNRSWFLVFAAFALLAALVTIVVAPRLLPGLRGPAAAPRTVLPSFAPLAAWRGSAPLTPDSLRGRPVALLLWCDTDPRSLAALPVLEAWHRGFGPAGARVLAVHEPEFAFASSPRAAAGVAARLHLTLPMADDTTHFLEGALGGPTDGPHLIVTDAGGRVVVDTVGDLAAGEAALRAAVHAAHPDAELPAAVDALLPGGVRTVFLASGRVEGGPLRGLSAGHERVFTAEFRYQEGGESWVPYPVGAWRTGPEGLTATRGGAANLLAIRYSASRVGVVVTPPPGGAARLWILRDDHWSPRADCDEDVTLDERGATCVQVREPRLYWIDRGAGEHVLELSPDVPGVTVNALVFTGARH